MVTLPKRYLFLIGGVVHECLHDDKQASQHGRDQRSNGDGPERYYFDLSESRVWTSRIRETAWVHDNAKQLLQFSRTRLS